MPFEAPYTEVVIGAEEEEGGQGIRRPGLSGSFQED